MDFDNQSQVRAAALPLLRELATLDIAVSDISELYNQRLNYKRAVPLLLEWLPRITNRDVRQQIVSALGTKWGKPVAADALIAEFENADSTGLDRWRVGSSLAAVVDDAHFEPVARLVRERRFGRARQEVVSRLGTLSDPRVLDLLIELLADDEVAGHAIIGLQRLKRPEAADAVRPFLSHPTSWVRTEARRALAKFESAAQTQAKIVPLRRDPPEAASGR
jgi:HEAT repeat protein